MARSDYERNRRAVYDLKRRCFNRETDETHERIARRRHAEFVPFVVLSLRFVLSVFYEH